MLKVYVFDFGSELYLWQGKAVTPAQRKVALKLAQQVWSRGYDYSSCDINPLCPLKTEEDGGLPWKSETRPDWALFAKVNQNMETILFREKFADWPDTSRLIQCKNPEDVRETKSDFANLKPYDAKLLVPASTVPVDLVLEGSHVGRGNRWELDMDGFIKVQNIDTVKVVVWHVLEYEHYLVEDHSYGQFHEGDTYVIRWQYAISSAGARNLKGQASKHSQQGRERYAYFFWQGKSSTINEKGASALMTVELDEERGPQIRVDEGKEPPCFLNLFTGWMMIHIGKREEEDTNTQGHWRFYCLRNEYENEMCLIEVPAECDSLRSVSSFVLLNVKTGSLTVWHGSKSPEHTRKLVVKAAENLKERCPMEVGLHSGTSISISEVDEGQEKTAFWPAVSVRMGDRSAYNSLLNNPQSFNHTLRLFHMTSVSGTFEVHEILNPSRTTELHTKFPVLQTDIYKVSQPAILMLDNGHEVYLWLGWWPEGDDNHENVLTGSAQTRFTADRRCAMETTLHYCKEINPDSPPSACVVYGGLEPLSFTNLFPFWTVDEIAMESNLRLASQHPYAEQFIGEPYVYTINIDDADEVRTTVQKILDANHCIRMASYQFQAYLPYEFTEEGFIQRMNAYLEHQNFCQFQKQLSKWPPETAVQSLFGEAGKSCKDVCWEKNLICEPSHFLQVNSHGAFQSYGVSCAARKRLTDIFYPALDTKTNDCILQQEELLFSCVGKQENLRRLCPCRTYVKGQTALCEGCA